MGHHLCISQNLVEGVCGSLGVALRVMSKGIRVVIVIDHGVHAENLSAERTHQAGTTGVQGLQYQTKSGLRSVPHEVTLCDIASATQHLLQEIEGNPTFLYGTQSETRCT